MKRSLTTFLITIFLSLFFSSVSYAGIVKLTVDGLNFLYDTNNDWVSVCNKNYPNVPTSDNYDFTDIVIPDVVEHDGRSLHVTKVENFAFAKCKNLESVYVSDNVTKLGQNTFDECSKLKNIRLSNNIVNLSINVFRKCTALESVIIPASVKKIWFNSFEKCDNLKDIILLGAAPTTEWALPANINVWTVRLNSIKGLPYPWLNRVKYIDSFSSALSTVISTSFVNDFTPLRLSSFDDASVDLSFADGVVYEANKGIEVVKSVDTLCYHFFSLPFNCRVGDIYSESGLKESNYGVNWYVAFYDGVAAAVSGNSNKVFWRNIADPDFVLEAGQGYIIGVGNKPDDFLDADNRVSMIFPHKEPVVLDYSHGLSSGKNVPLSPSFLKSHDGRSVWSLVGLNLLHSAKGFQLFCGDQLIRYISLPDGNNGYSQFEVSQFDGSIASFSAFFVQTGFGGELRAVPVSAAPTVADEERIELVVSDSVVVDNTVLLGAADYSVGFDSNADLSKLFSSASPQLFSVVSGEALAFAALPLNKFSEGVDVVFSRPDNKDYSISLSSCSFWGREVVLLDRLNGRRTNLSRGDYSFNHVEFDGDARFLVSVVDADTATGLQAPSLDGVSWHVDQDRLCIEGLPEGASAQLFSVAGLRVGFSSLPEGTYILVISNNDDYKSYKIFI